MNLYSNFCLYKIYLLTEIVAIIKVTDVILIFAFTL